MSSGLIFNLIKKTDKTVSDKVYNDIKHRYDENYESYSIKSEITYPILFQLHKDESEKYNYPNLGIYVGKDDKRIYHDLIEQSFTSCMNFLKPELDLFTYTDIRFISVAKAERMVQALKYILSEKYSNEFEDILNNHYIQIFGDEYVPYICRYQKSKRFTDDEYYGLKHSYKRLMAFLENFVYCYDEMTYISNGDELMLIVSGY